MRPFYFHEGKNTVRNILNINTILLFDRVKKIITLLATLHSFAIY